MMVSWAGGSVGSRFAFVSVGAFSGGLAANSVCDVRRAIHDR